MHTHTHVHVQWKHTHHIWRCENICVSNSFGIRAALCRRERKPPSGSASLSSSGWWDYCFSISSCLCVCVWISFFACCCVNAASRSLSVVLSSSFFLDINYTMELILKCKSDGSPRNIFYQLNGGEDESLLTRGRKNCEITFVILILNFSLICSYKHIGFIKRVCLQKSA